MTDVAIVVASIAAYRAGGLGPCWCSADTDRVGYRCGKRFAHDGPHGSTSNYGTIDVTADMIKAFRAKGGSASLKLGTAAVSISNTQRTIMMAALDGPVTEFPADLVPYIESLRHAGLIQWTATGYRITAQGRASLKWEHVIAPGARP